MPLPRALALCFGLLAAARRVNAQTPALPWAASAGLRFQLLSNGGQTAPSPGIGAVGLTADSAWSLQA